MREPCPIQEDCKWFTTGDNKPPNHHVRLTHPCIHFNGEWCEDTVVGAKEGDACDITKRHELFKQVLKRGE
ncbi:hypothetical protein LCGC14_2322810 [marine sediment metagenome]|uniref:Uncharacterized protein n=1 Tax=marine sediment metagenome TaxID=412755 RepID=A0A0F9D4U8_9ZZZZ